MYIKPDENYIIKSDENNYILLEEHPKGKIVSNFKCRIV